jgi:predicted enzyme related to lactoylglutathione lyase
MEIKSGHIEIFVNDPQKAKDFYVGKLDVSWYQNSQAENCLLNQVIR